MEGFYTESAISKTQYSQFLQWRILVQQIIM